MFCILEVSFARNQRTAIIISFGLMKTPIEVNLRLEISRISQIFFGQNQHIFAIKAFSIPQIIDIAREFP
jgi:hypothetical protein